ncbi:MAG: aspartate-semialdehyde dehydrogenase [Puniceicoccales bacterium]|jgi:aspartate-semialdehyde dehydrogenase|nr:aspartate-semialdehyde dehydrogenase [Puniceicoccales bacterium]
MVLHKMNTIGIVGATGLVGQTLFEELLKMPACRSKNFVLFSSDKTAGHLCTLKGFRSKVENLTDNWLKRVDFWFFATPQHVAAHWIPSILNTRCANCIDGSSAFRLHKDIPLIIPEINIRQLTRANRLVASPNCTTTIALMALWPLHKVFHLKRFWVHSYQSASGMGNDGMRELEEQVKSWSEGKSHANVRNFHKPLAFNAIPQIGNLDADGVSEEECKLVLESKKILGDANLKIFANCVRIPVLRCHSMEINAEFDKRLNLDEAKMALKSAEGLCWYEEGYPTALEHSKQSACGVGRLRYDNALDNGIAMWVVGDQLLKGAALNMVQIFQHWINL